MNNEKLHHEKPDPTTATRRDDGNRLNAKFMKNTKFMKKHKNHVFYKALGPISFSSSRNLVQNRTSSSENCALRAEL